MNYTNCNHNTSSSSNTDSNTAYLSIIIIILFCNLCQFNAQTSIDFTECQPNGTKCYITVDGNTYNNSDGDIICHPNITECFVNVIANSIPVVYSSKSIECPSSLKCQLCKITCWDTAVCSQKIFKSHHCKNVEIYIYGTHVDLVINAPDNNGNLLIMITKRTPESHWWTNTTLDRLIVYGNNKTNNILIYANADEIFYSQINASQINGILTYTITGATTSKQAIIYCPYVTGSQCDILCDSSKLWNCLQMKVYATYGLTNVNWNCNPTTAHENTCKSATLYFGENYDRTCVWRQQSGSIWLLEGIKCSLTHHPTFYPTTDPTEEPTYDPTVEPTSSTLQPTPIPTSIPTSPTLEPTIIPTSYPTFDPTINPTFEPILIPTRSPTSSTNELCKSNNYIDLYGNWTEQPRCVLTPKKENFGILLFLPNHYNYTLFTLTCRLSITSIQSDDQSNVGVMFNWQTSPVFSYYAGMYPNGRQMKIQSVISDTFRTHYTSIMTNVSIDIVYEIKIERLSITLYNIYLNDVLMVGNVELNYFLNGTFALYTYKTTATFYSFEINVVNGSVTNETSVSKYVTETNNLLCRKHEYMYLTGIWLEIAPCQFNVNWYSSLYYAYLLLGSSRNHGSPLVTNNYYYNQFELFSITLRLQIYSRTCKINKGNVGILFNAQSIDAVVKDHIQAYSIDIVAKSGSMRIQKWNNGNDETKYKKKILTGIDHGIAYEIKIEKIDVMQYDVYLDENKIFNNITLSDYVNGTIGIRGYKCNSIFYSLEIHDITPTKYPTNSPTLYPTSNPSIEPTINPTILECVNIEFIIHPYLIQYITIHYTLRNLINNCNE
eukprot:239561_1